MKKSQLTQLIREEIQKVMSEASIPSNVTAFAKQRHVLPLVNQVAGWAKKIGKSIVGGTAIGKNYSTLILDLTHHGGEVRINLDTEQITVNDEEVETYEEFAAAIQSAM